MKTYKGLIQELEPNQIIVFGSNPEGRHGAGVARLAKNKFGAINGQGRGLQGQSYGLVTTNLTSLYVESETGIIYYATGKKGVPTDLIIDNIKELYDFAEENNHLEFLVAYTDNGYNLNGYSSEEMAEMFSSHEIPNNIIFHDGFSKLLK